MDEVLVDTRNFKVGDRVKICIGCNRVNVGLRQDCYLCGTCLPNESIKMVRCTDCGDITPSLEACVHCECLLPCS
jgi:hypothetical protein